MDVPVLYEDRQILAVNKPAGLLVIAGRGSLATAPTLIGILNEHRQTPLMVVHRIDQGASGLVMLAKDPDSHRRLCRQFEKHEIRKTYLVLVHGAVVQDEGVVEQPIYEYGSGRMGVDQRGKRSVTRYSVRERIGRATLLEVRPVTGRRHQIRVHLYSIGHQVVGDARYGPQGLGVGSERLMLHAWQAALRAPGGRAINLEAPLPADFLEVLERYRKSQS